METWEKLIYLIIIDVVKANNVGVALAGPQKVDFLCAVYLSADNLHCVLLSGWLLHALAADRETSIAQQTITLKVDFVVLKEKRILKKGLFFILMKSLYVGKLVDSESKLTST